MRPRWHVPVVVVLAVASGCAGYAHYFPLPPGAKGVRTFHVDLFANKTLYTDIEFEFTEALRKEISAKTPLRATLKPYADTLVKGAVENYQLIVDRESETDEVSRYTVRITVSYQWFRRPEKKGQRPKLIRSHPGLARSVQYEVHSNATEADARAEGIRKLARKVVSHMFETW